MLHGRGAWVWSLISGWVTKITHVKQCGPHPPKYTHTYITIKNKIIRKGEWGFPEGQWVSLPGSRVDCSQDPVLFIAHSKLSLGLPRWLVVKNLPASAGTWVQSPGPGPLEKEARGISCTEEPGGLQPRGWQESLTRLPPIIPYQIVLKF